MDNIHIIIVLLLLAVFLLALFTLLAVRRLQTGDCVGVPKFDPTSVYTKSLTIPMISKTVSGTITFKLDNTFVLDANGSVFPNNKWTYDENNCQIIVSIDPDIDTLVKKYNCSLDTEVKLNKKGQLIVSGTIMGILPIKVYLDKKET